ncbi:MAG: hypothetical protein WBE13_17830 [Candidatus Acidiferrum sp.]
MKAPFAIGILFVGLGAPGSARAAVGMPCTAEMLDVQVLPPMEPRASIGLHELVIEFQNRSGIPCRFSEGFVQIVPRNADIFTRDFYGQRPPSASEREFQNRKNELWPGATAHILVVWRSRPTALYPECTNRDNIGISLGPVLPPFVKIEHLWMRLCGYAYVSLMGLGAYRGEPHLGDWFQRFDVKGADIVAPALFKPQAPGYPPIGLEPIGEQLMLNDFFDLFVNLPKPDIDCPFLVLRKREADGQTTVYVNHCEESGGGQVDLQQGRWTARLMPLQIGMQPERTGRVEYEVFSRVREGEKFVYAEATTSVVVKDPTPPGMPEIASGLPECLAAQLTAERVAALKEGKFHDAEIYEVTNASDKACRLGGVPQLEFWFPTGGSHSATPLACPNCEDPLFKPRPNGWIDLTPGGSAHFLVGATRYNTESGAWRQICDVVEKLVLTLREGQTMTLPFGVGTCKGVNVSAWREGKYDHDPLNVAYEKSVGKRGEETVPAQCATADFGRLGRPMMLENPMTLWPRGDLQFGLSVVDERILPGQPAMLHLWINNPGDKEEPVFTCMTLDFLWAEDFDLYDAYGHRLLRKKEWEPRGKPSPGAQEKPNQACVGSWMCTMNYAIPIPAHTCVNGAAEPTGYEFNRDLLTYYDLPPGTYYVVPRTSKMDPNRCREVAPKVDPATLRDKLRIRVERN